MRLALRHQQQHFAIDVHREGSSYRVVIDGEPALVEARTIDDATVLLVIDGRHYRAHVARDGHNRSIAVGGETYTFSPEGSQSAHVVANVAAPEITAPMPGKVLQVLVRPGDHVAAGDGLVILEAMKMETRLVAEAPATVAEVRVAEGAMVVGGQVLVVLQYDEVAPQEA